MKELCEVEGIKFYDTPEMGIACRVNEINTVITGKSNGSSFRREMLDYQHIKDAFPNVEERNKQIQDLEFPGIGQKLFVSLRIILVHLEEGEPKKYKEGFARVLQAIKKNSILNSTSYETYQEETMKELREIEGIKFFETSEMGIVCSVSEISTVITGKPNQGGIRRDMLTHKYVEAKFPDPEMRKKQIQHLEYPGMGKQSFISLELLLLYLERDNSRKKYKEKRN